MEFRKRNPSLPLDRSWRLGGNVVNNAVDAFDFTDDALMINGPKLIKAISEKLSLVFTDKIARYRIPGIYDKEQRALIFDTADAEAVPKKERKPKGARTTNMDAEDLPED